MSKAENGGAAGDVWMTNQIGLEKIHSQPDIAT